MRLALIIGLAVTIGDTAHAAEQERKFYGRDGSFQGSSRPLGRDTNYYNRQGNYEGQARPCAGGGTCFYNRQGLYQGREQ